MDLVGAVVAPVDCDGDEDAMWRVAVDVDGEMLLADGCC